MNKVDVLLAVAEAVGAFGKGKITTSGLATRLGTSQQTVSNNLSALDKSGYIKRIPGYDGTTAALTRKGREILENYAQRISAALQPKNTLTGTVFTGLGEGRFYTELPEYKKQFVRLLGIRPYPGTLNLKVDKEDLASFLHKRVPITIQGFKTGRRSYGNISCYPVKIGQYKCAITIPERTSHKDTIEIISELSLRKILKLKDNNKVQIKWLKKQ